MRLTALRRVKQPKSHRLKWAGFRWVSGGLTTLSTLPALGLDLWFLPAPEHEPAHDEDDNDDYRQKCLEGAATSRRTALMGAMVGEGRGGEQDRD